MTLSRSFWPWVTVCLLLAAGHEASGLSSVYEVKKGDSLWSISKTYKTSVGDLKRLNGLKSSKLYPGQVLKLGPSIKEIPAENGPYYWQKPREDEQQSRDYLERSKSSPATDYGHARLLLQAFDVDLAARMARQGGRRPLRGWRIVIDPGHGGLDPGAIVANRDGVNRSVYVVEDEYVYDVAMRLYERLRLLGADVGLTLLSPNHLIRENLRASVTFVHERNEVYNDEGVNRKNSDLVRPRSANLAQRVQIANRFYRGAPKRKTLFISIHADNSPGRPKGPLAIYLKRKGKIDRTSRKFAQVMQRALSQPDMPAQIQGRSLMVLRNNRAHAEILVETHNVHDKGDAYRLRFHKNRKAAAEKIVKGVLAYAKGG